MEFTSFCDDMKPFLRYVFDWYNHLYPAHLDDVVANGAERVALFAVDVTRGFCSHGPLASPRVAAIVPHITALFEAAHARGVRHFLLPQDTHTPDAAEFSAYPPHCLAGTDEAQTVPELNALPFSSSFIVHEKNGLHSALDTDLNPWLDEHPEVDTLIVTGDCTDLCTYQLAMHLQVRAHTRNLPVRVIVPVDCVQTYDLPVHVAKTLGALPHDGDLLHVIFLYHMRLNGIEVVSTVA